MIKTLFVGVWACLITLAASYEANILLQARANRPAQPASASETRKSREISVPIIRDGAVKGYVVVQLSYVVDVAIADKLPAPPDAFVSDEIFRYIYDDEKLDFTHIEKLDLGKLTAVVIKKINARLKAEVVTDMGVIECNYLLNTEAKPKP